MRKLFEQVIESEEREIPKYFIVVTFAWIIFEFEGLEAAINYLGSIDQKMEQPWQSTTPYINIVSTAMRYVVNKRGLQNFYGDLFEPLLDE